MRAQPSPAASRECIGQPFSPKRKIGFILGELFLFVGMPCVPITVFLAQVRYSKAIYLFDINGYFVMQHTILIPPIIVIPSLLATQIVIFDSLTYWKCVLSVGEDGQLYHKGREVIKIQDVYSAEIIEKRHIIDKLSYLELTPYHGDPIRLRYTFREKPDELLAKFRAAKAGFQAV